MDAKEVIKQRRKDYFKEYYLKHRDSRLAKNKANSELYKAKRREKKLQDPHKAWAKCTLSMHRVKYDVLLTYDELIVMARGSDTCPLCGTKFDWMGKSNQANLPSLDRLHNEPTITAHNVWIICFECNMSKRNRSIQDFIDYCCRVADVYRS